MKPYQSIGVGPAEPSPSRPHPVGLPRTRYGLSLLLLAFWLSMVLLMPAYAADGSLDPTFNTGSGLSPGCKISPKSGE